MLLFHSSPKPFAFEPFRMRTHYRFIEGYRGNDTVRGWYARREACSTPPCTAAGPMGSSAAFSSRAAVTERPQVLRRIEAECAAASERAHLGAAPRGAGDLFNQGLSYYGDSG